MPIFILSPTATASTNWERSTFKGDAIFRADNETDARALAALEFGLPNGYPDWSPWRDSSAVSCVPAPVASGTLPVPAGWGSVIPFEPPDPTRGRVLR